MDGVQLENLKTVAQIIAYVLVSIVSIVSAFLIRNKLADGVVKKDEAEAGNTEASTTRTNVNTAIEATSKAADEWKKLYETIKADYEQFKTDALNDVTNLRNDVDKLRSDLDNSIAENSKLKRGQEELADALSRTKEALDRTRLDHTRALDSIAYIRPYLLQDDKLRYRATIMQDIQEGRLLLADADKGITT